MPKARDEGERRRSRHHSGGQSRRDRPGREGRDAATRTRIEETRAEKADLAAKLEYETAETAVRKRIAEENRGLQGTVEDLHKRLKEVTTPARSTTNLPSFDTSSHRSSRGAEDGNGELTRETQAIDPRFAHYHTHRVGASKAKAEGTPRTGDHEASSKALLIAKSKIQHLKNQILHMQARYNELETTFTSSESSTSLSAYACTDKVNAITTLNTELTYLRQIFLSTEARHQKALGFVPEGIACPRWQQNPRARTAKIAEELSEPLSRHLQAGSIVGCDDFGEVVGREGVWKLQRRVPEADEIETEVNAASHARFKVEENSVRAEAATTVQEVGKTDGPSDSNLGTTLAPSLPPKPPSSLTAHEHNLEIIAANHHLCFEHATAKTVVPAGDEKNGSIGAGTKRPTEGEAREGGRKKSKPFFRSEPPRVPRSQALP